MVRRLRYEERQRRQEMIDALRARIGNLPFVTLREVEGQLCLVQLKTGFTFTPDPDAEFTLLARFENSHAAQLTAEISGVLGGRVAALRLLTLLEGAVGVIGATSVEDAAMDLLDMLVTDSRP